MARFRTAFTFCGLLALGAALLLAARVSGGAATTRATATPRAASSEVATTPASDAGTPRAAGASAPAGTLQYRTGQELVSVALPGMAELSRTTVNSSATGVASADGRWMADNACPSGACPLTITSSDGSVTRTVGPVVSSFAWAPSGHVLVAGVGAAETFDMSELAVIDPEMQVAASPLYTRADASITAFTWRDDARVVFATQGKDGTDRVAEVTLNDGAVRALATVTTRVNYLYSSPDGKSFAFTQDDALGWQLHMLDAESGKARNLGNMGSDAPGTPPVQYSPEQKGPMYIAWSPDGSRLAFGGGFAPPYYMTTVDLAPGRSVRTDFTDGYPGEIRWSPDGTQLAVSTYNLERTHHEAYIVDPASGVARDLISGCHILWSPDGEFLAVRGERNPGVWIARVASGAATQVSSGAKDAPVAWTRRRPRS